MSSWAPRAAVALALAGLAAGAGAGAWLERADDAFAAGDCASAVPAYERALLHGPASFKSEHV